MAAYETGGQLVSNTLHLPQQEARDLAARCATVLRQRFGAKRVILFGFVVGDGTWHSGSDLDLAVEGIAPEQFFPAWVALREILPPGLEVDLVDLEHASEALRARVLGEKPMSEESFRVNCSRDMLATPPYSAHPVARGGSGTRVLHG